MSTASYLASFWSRGLLQLGNNLPAKSIQQSDIAAQKDHLYYMYIRKIGHLVLR